MVDVDLPHEHELLSPINFEVTADTVPLVQKIVGFCHFCVREFTVGFSKELSC